MDTVKWLAEDHGLVYTYGFMESIFDNPDNKTIITVMKHYTSAMYQADTIYVTTDMMHILLQAAHDLPDDVVFDSHVLLSKRGFVLFEEPIEGIDRHGKTVVLHALLWELDRVAANEKQPDGSEVIMLYFMTDPMDFTDEANKEYFRLSTDHSFPIPPLLLAHIYPAFVGHELPVVSEVGTEIVVGLCKLFVAMQIIAQQKIGAPIKLDPDRASRKRYHREWGKDAPDRIITLITLRRKSIKKDDHEPQKVEWSRRWVVQGFWRRQWYPKSQRHDWKYIHEYIKGPEDKPLIITERRIFNFRR